MKIENRYKYGIIQTPKDSTYIHVMSKEPNNTLVVQLSDEDASKVAKALEFK